MTEATQMIEYKPLTSKIMDALEKHGSLTRNQLVSFLKRPRTTIYDHLDVLINKNQVKKYPRQVNGRGRPHIFFKLKKN